MYISIRVTAALALLIIIPINVFATGIRHDPGDDATPVVGELITRLQGEGLLSKRLKV